MPSEPANDHGYLNPLPLLESELASATAHARWTVPGDPQSIIDAIEANPPAGATLAGSGSGGNVKTGTSELEVDYQWPPIAGVLGTRLLRVTVTGVGGGLAGVLAEAQSVWIVPRPASERISAATRIVEINSAVPGAADGGYLTIRRPAQVGRPWKVASSGECSPVQLSIDGRRRTALDGGGFLRQIEQIIGVSIT